MTTSTRNIDQIARRVLMTSFLYYRHDLSLIPDSEFDELAGRLAFRWMALDPLLQWQLGSAHDIASGGGHCKITLACEGGAIAWAKRRTLTTLPCTVQSEWTWCEQHQVHWISAA